MAKSPDLSPHTRPTIAEALAGDTCLLASSVFDPISARFAKDLGCSIGLLGGSIAAQVVLGAPDIVLLTADELVQQTRRICRTGCVDLIVDGDHGYGNALNVRRTVQELQAAGAGAVCLEDTLLPRAFGSDDTQQLVSIEEGCKKLSAALDARGDGPMLILARTNAIASHGLEETIRRLTAYQTLDVDALFVPYLKSREQLDAIAQVATKPLVTAGSHADVYDLDYLASRGVKIWGWGHQPYAVALKSLYEAMHALHHGSTPDQFDRESMQRFLNLGTDVSGTQELIKKFLR